MAEAAGIQQTVHQTLDAAPEIPEDPICPLLIDLASETSERLLPRGIGTQPRQRLHFRGTFVMRSRHMNRQRRLRV